MDDDYYDFSDITEFFAYNTLKNATRDELIEELALIVKARKARQPWHRELYLQILKWQILLWLDFRVYVHGTRHRQQNSEERYLDELKKQYTKCSELYLS